MQHFIQKILFVGLAVNIHAAAASKADTINPASAADAAVHSAARVDGLNLLQRASLNELYRSRQIDPLWVDTKGWTAAAVELLGYVQDVYSHGLPPSRYHYGQLSQLQARTDRDSLRKAEILLSDAFLQLLIDLGPQPAAAADRKHVHLDVILNPAMQASPAQTLDARLPRAEQYWALRRALQAWLRAETDRERELGTLRASRFLQQGDTGPQVLALAKALKDSGDFTGEPGAVFTPELTAALKRFQQRHFLDVDGLVGPMTAREIGADHASRTQQIISNLERWREQGDRPDSYVQVNIPAQEARYLFEGEEQLRMDVIVGRTDRPTPRFSSSINELVLNPDWTVPYRIAVRDKLPLIQNDPEYLARHNYSVRTDWHPDAPRVAAEDIDWNELNEDNFPYVLRQQPGASNALGRVKFLFPNPYSVYLHDTPQKSLFSRNQRLFSSGCVRLAEPMELAALVLRNHAAPSLEVDLSEEAAQPTSIALREPLPVYLDYWSAWVDENDELRFYPDVYQRDQRMAAARQSRALFASAATLVAHLEQTAGTLLASNSSAR